STQRGDDVIDGFGIPVGGDLEMNTRRPRPEVISNGQCSAPAFGSDLAAQSREKRLGIGIRNREHGNLGDGFRFAQRQPFRSRNGGHAWSERVAGIISVHDASALYAITRTPAAVGVIVAVVIPVVPWIGINNAPDCTVFGGNFGLDAAPAFAVSRDHD